MAEIVDFPIREVRDRAGLERVVRDTLQPLGHGQELTDHVVTQVESLFDKLGGGWKVAFPTECVPCFERIDRDICEPFRAMINALMVEVVRREVELFQLRRANGSPWNA